MEEEVLEGVSEGGKGWGGREEHLPIFNPSHTNQRKCLFIEHD